MLGENLHDKHQCKFFQFCSLSFQYKLFFKNVNNFFEKTVDKL